MVIHIEGSNYVQSAILPHYIQATHKEDLLFDLDLNYLFNLGIVTFERVLGLIETLNQQEQQQQNNIAIVVQKQQETTFTILK
ncbi:hypothetical protein DDB_G0284929 [Dictyostelium discoideum AX4]|uniref:Putative uncharacterized protein DDB_G0284929 n=1 Tax=Dictyostelium discoideum TaxID=44689 RepID=Y6263_DICDI|nr:hypothetical protein DDB_G0284929 [Dictyostelium discoideum AX4]Q54NX9.1 RecName: Full=Putative uncharacterized protein DDB_G0284929 [Dictyostelium discoideum]EAL64928.1 hypothetical protein DDB_G0284929 [Dictyostelium discoideum AX4]|eukprot:XP_639938.1 hypothetical protein DDB_G0284929 [Dictyostelium discoideum AX4]